MANVKGGDKPAEKSAAAEQENMSWSESWAAAKAETAKIQEEAKLRREKRSAERDARFSSGHGPQVLV